MEILSRIAFWVIFAVMITMQVYFSLRFRVTKEHKTAYPKSSERENWVHYVIRSIRAISLAVFLGLYIVNHPWLGVLSLPLPGWLRWIGVAVGFLSLALYAWSRATLGKEWSSNLLLGENHSLVTTGPYRWIRHPIYLAMIGFMISIALVTADLFLVAFLLVSTIDLALRIPKEEQMMVEKFGEEYKTYMQRTGRIFPKLSSLTPTPPDSL